MISIAKPLVDETEANLVLEVLRSGVLASGSYVERFEKEFATYVGVGTAAAASNGTTALHAALEAVGVGAEDEVITTPFTFIATANSILYCNARPVFVDIDSLTYNLCPSKVRMVLKKRPNIKAIMLVHLYGLPCDMDEYMAIGKEYGVKIIEDCAQAHGAKYKGKVVGSFGDSAAFSFYPTKNMTTAEGGMVVSKYEDVIAKAKVLINHGQKQRYYHEVLGYNYRMTNIHAAIGLAQLAKLENFNARRRAIAGRYNEAFAGLNFARTPYIPEDCEHVYHQYTLLLERDRDGFVNYLSQNQIGYGIHYPIPLNQQPVYKERGYGNEVCPNAEETAKRVISIPVHPGLTDAEVDYVIEKITRYQS